MRHLLCAALFAASSAQAEPPPAAMVDTPVLVRTVERGEALAAADFEMKPATPGAARGALPPQEAVGKEAARRLMAGAIVRQGDLVRPQIVCRGDAVVLAVRSGALSITTSGRALSGGGIGDAVRVVNLETNRTLGAIVEGKGQVHIAAAWEEK